MAPTSSSTTPLSFPPLSPSFSKLSAVHRVLRTSCRLVACTSCPSTRRLRSASPLPRTLLVLLIRSTCTVYVTLCSSRDYACSLSGLSLHSTPSLLYAAQVPPITTTTTLSGATSSPREPPPRATTLRSASRPTTRARGSSTATSTSTSTPALLSSWRRTSLTLRRPTPFPRLGRISARPTTPSRLMISRRLAY